MHTADYSGWESSIVSKIAFGGRRELPCLWRLGPCQRRPQLLYEASVSRNIFAKPQARECISSQFI